MIKRWGVGGGGGGVGGDGCGAEPIKVAFL